jgi:hypothetical protein
MPNYLGQQSLAYRSLIRSALGEARCFQMQKRFAGPDNGIHWLPALEIQCSTMSREWPHVDVRDTFVAVGGDLGQRRVDHRKSIAFRHRARLAHERQERITVSVNHTATENHARSRTIPEQPERNTGFCFIRIRPSHLH